MQFGTGRTPEDKRGVRGWITPERLVLYCLPVLALYLTMLVLWARVSHGFTAPDISHPGADLAVFWTASWMFLHDHAWRVYDFSVFSRQEVASFPFFHPHDFLPWLYPPTFLVVVAPLALMPFSVAYAVWSVIGLGMYIGSVRRVAELDRLLRPGASMFVLASSPFAIVSVMFGQNSLLTASLAALALYWLERRPLVAGICIGLLAIKPQMAILFPLALLMARAWRAMASAALTTLVFAAVSVAICGWKSVEMFRQGVALGRFILLYTPHFWYASPTPFAALRLAGVSVDLALALHICISLLAIVVMCRIWCATNEVAERAAIFAIATILTNPYLWHYELTWLGIAVVSLISIGLRSGWRRGEQVLILLAWLLPIYEVFNRVTGGPQLGPVIVLSFLLLLARRNVGFSGCQDAIGLRYR